ncbi:histidine-containing phosphotransfer protein [Musa troglodytarum]|uniref:Histidine-containing phosphotransfer protein n=1 Tax=Musa troglodytarum TaxID=320322 RepID=A0A9E7GWL7_9LILI|nr:histidine-containing phosphotransfer protein [Musa troglodytarum]
MALHISSALAVSARLHPLLRFCFHNTCPEMENASGLQRQLASMKKNLFDQGYLDEQFNQLEELQDESSPNFVEEVVTLFFRDSSRLMANIDQALEQCPRDFHRLHKLLHRLKGSASSIGAAKMKNECTSFGEFCSEENLEGCPRSFQKVKKEHTILRQKLESYFQSLSLVPSQLLRQVGPVDKATPSCS